MKTGSFRWWFENRETGRITVAQFPNWPLWGIAGIWLIRTIVGPSSTVADVLTWLGAGLWLYWGGAELFRGVNPWRRLIGAGVIAWQVFGLF